MKEDTMRKNICVCLALVILLSSVSIIVGAVDFGSIVGTTSELGIVEQKSFSTATLEDDFADNHVLVVLNNKASLNFKEYSVSDFKEVKCAAVSDLTSGKKKQVETKVNDFKSSVSTMSAESRAAAVEDINKYNQIICLELADKGKENVLAAIKALQSRGDVIYAGPDYVMSLCSTTPTDTHYNDQWAIPAIGLDHAWELTTGSSNVYVGVVDTGIDASHPDLQGRIATALCADFSAPVVQYIVPNDITGHGTHVAGIIAANMNNQGIAGAASGVKIVALRVADQSGNCKISCVIDATDYAEVVGIQIVNISLGIDPEKSVDEDLLNALSEAFENYSGSLVCAAGNDTTNTDHLPSYPSSLTNDNIIAVGANRANGEKRDDSNYGATSVDVFAPGDNILSCFPTAKCLAGTCETDPGFADTHHSNGYHAVPGTSMAAPYVTAIAALMLSENPSLTPQVIKSRIIATCTPSPYLTNKCVSDGIVNACHAVLSAYPSTPMTADTSRSISISAGQERWIKFDVPSSGIYSFFTSGSHHTVGELFHYTEGLRERSSNANSAISSNFYIEEHLTAGTTVYLRVKLKQATASGSFTLYIASP